MLSKRLRAAGSFSLKHLLVSTAVAGLCAILVFFVWYPYPYSELAGGRGLFLLVVSVDVIVGPLLSFVVFDPAKPKHKLWRDLGVIFLVQLFALAYGLHSVTQARPVWLAFEGDRFRIVAVPDVNRDELGRAEGEFNNLSWTGPKLVGVRLLKSTDPEYANSIQRAMQGEHPAFRPDRWVDYQLQTQEAIRQAKPLAELKRKHPARVELLEESVRNAGFAEGELGYLPLASEHRTDWSVLITLKDGVPRLYVPLDAW